MAGAVATRRWGLGYELPRQPEEVVVHLAWLGLVLIAGWWSVNVAAWAWALRSGIALTRFTLPGSRRAAQALLAISLGLAASSTTACVAEGSSAPSMVLVEGEQTSTTLDALEPASTSTAVPSTAALSTAVPSTAVPSTAVPSTAVPSTAVPSTAVPSTAENPPGIVEDQGDPVDEIEPTEATDARSVDEHRVVVAEGDNLWTLSADALQQHGVDDPTTAEIAAYWRTVVTSNPVRSGNPDLILIGEIITMPAFDLGG